jgi:hypothetical protein
MEGGKLSEEREREGWGEYQESERAPLQATPPLPPVSVPVDPPLQRNAFLFLRRDAHSAVLVPIIYITRTRPLRKTRRRTHPPSLSASLSLSHHQGREGKGLHLTCSRSATDNEDTARRLLLLPRGGGAPPEEAPVGGRGTIPRRVRGGHVGGAARRPGGVDPRLRRRDRRVAGRPRRRHAHVRASSGSDQVAWAEEWVGIMVF